MIHEPSKKICYYVALYSQETLEVNIDEEDLELLTVASEQIIIPDLKNR